MVMWVMSKREWMVGGRCLCGAHGRDGQGMVMIAQYGSPRMMMAVKRVVMMGDGLMPLSLLLL